MKTKEEEFEEKTGIKSPTKEELKENRILKDTILKLEEINEGLMKHDLALREELRSLNIRNKQLENDLEQEQSLRVQAIKEYEKLLTKYCKIQKSQEMMEEKIEELFEKEIRNKKYGVSEVLAITFYKNKLLSKIGGKE